MNKLDLQVESLQVALDMLRDTLKGINGTIDLYDLNNDSSYIKRRAEQIYNTIQEALDKAGFDY